MNTYSPLRQRARSAHRGFTLIELMIAILIAVFLIGGLLTLVSGMKRASVSQGGLSELQDNQRIAMTLINDVIQSAGYFPDPTINTSATSLPVVGPFTFAGQSIFGTGASTDPAPGNAITVRYLTSGADNVINCMGNISPVPATFINTFSVDLATGDLICSLNAGAPVHLATGITTMQIYYGVQTNPAATTNSVDTYMDATTVTGLNLWNKVLSVKVQLTFKNPLAGQPGQLPTIQFMRVVDVMSKTGVTT
jgi:type IV pilus assembly protein PilW